MKRNITRRAALAGGLTLAAPARAAPMPVAITDPIFAAIETASESFRDLL
jgi:hypothetical protein